MLPVYQTLPQKKSKAQWNRPAAWVCWGIIREMLHGKHLSVSSTWQNPTTLSWWYQATHADFCSSCLTWSPFWWIKSPSLLELCYRLFSIFSLPLFLIYLDLCRLQFILPLSASTNTSQKGFSFDQTTDPQEGILPLVALALFLPGPVTSGMSPTITKLWRDLLTCILYIPLSKILSSHN